MSCSMGFNEFKELWAVLSGWKQHFMSIDRDASGTVDPQEMSQAISSMGNTSYEMLYAISYEMLVWGTILTNN